MYIHPSAHIFTYIPSMQRKILKKLAEWKNSAERKPLILQGARQTGKTYTVTEFGSKFYSSVVYCNFEREPNLASLFSDLSPNHILPNLGAIKQQKIFPRETLVVFDEVQACPKALTSLKYFCEEAPDIHIIALGSLLGVAVNRAEFSFPVGKVQFLDMHPLDFEEYLFARGDDFFQQKISECFAENTPMEKALHVKALEIYREYLFVGGMPAAVDNFVRNRNPLQANIIKQDILAAYQNDMSKYNKPNEIAKTRLVYSGIGKQLAKENKKFQYRGIKPGARASEFENAIEWICLSGIALKVSRLEHIALPFSANTSDSDFKLYMNDVGLCCASQNATYDDIVYENPLFNDFKGGLAENYVYTQLKANHIESYYWNESNQNEIDFILRLNNDIIPVEVKAAAHNKSQSLNAFVKKYKPPYSIRISTKNFGFENGIKSVPLYAAGWVK